MADTSKKPMQSPLMAGAVGGLMQSTQEQAPGSEFGVGGAPTGIGEVGGESGDPLEGILGRASSIYNVPPPMYDPYIDFEDHPHLADAHDQYALNFRKKLKLDDYFKLPLAGLTNDEVAIQSKIDALGGAVGQDLALGMAGPEEGFQASLAKLQALMGNAPQAPLPGEKQAPSVGSSILAAVGSMLFPESATEIGMAPYRAEESARLAADARAKVEFMNELASAEAAIKAQQIEVEIQQFRVETERYHARIAAETAEALRKADFDREMKASGLLGTHINRMHAGPERITDADISEYVRLAVATGTPKEQALKDAQDVRRQKDTMLFIEMLNDDVVQIKSQFSKEFMQTAMGATTLKLAAEALANKMETMFPDADPAMRAKAIAKATLDIRSLFTVSETYHLGDLRLQWQKSEWKADFDESARRFNEEMKLANSRFNLDIEEFNREGMKWLAEYHQKDRHATIKSLSGAGKGVGLDISDELADWVETGETLQKAEAAKAGALASLALLDPMNDKDRAAIITARAQIATADAMIKSAPNGSDVVIWRAKQKVGLFMQQLAQQGLSEDEAIAQIKSILLPAGMKGEYVGMIADLLAGLGIGGMVAPEQSPEFGPGPIGQAGKAAYEGQKKK